MHQRNALAKLKLPTKGRYGGRGRIGLRPDLTYLHDLAEVLVFVPDQRRGGRSGPLNVFRPLAGSRDAEVVDFLDRKPKLTRSFCDGRSPDPPARPAGNMTSTAGEFFATMVRLTSSDGQGRLNRISQAFTRPRVASITSRIRCRAVRSLPRFFTLRAGAKREPEPAGKRIQASEVDCP